MAGNASTCNGVALALGVGTHHVADSLPANFTSPSTNSAFNSKPLRQKPAPPPKPNARGPKVQKVLPGTGKPLLPKKPVIADGVLTATKKSCPLAAYRYQGVDEVDRPKVFEAFVKPAENSVNVTCQKPIPPSKKFNSLPSVKRLETAAPVAITTSSASTSASSSSSGAQLDVESCFEPVRDFSPSPEASRRSSPFRRSPVLSGRESPGFLIRHGAMRAKKGDRTSQCNTLPLSPPATYRSASPTTSGMRSKAGPAGSSSNDAFLWGADDVSSNARPLSHSKSLEADQLLSPTRGTRSASLAPSITTRGSSIPGGSAPSSPSHSRSSSPRRDSSDSDLSSASQAVSLSGSMSDARVGMENRGQPALPPKDRYEPGSGSSWMASPPPVRRTASELSTASFDPLSASYKPGVSVSNASGRHSRHSPSEVTPSEAGAVQLSDAAKDNKESYKLATPVKESSKRAFADAFAKFSGGLQSEGGEQCVVPKRLSNSMSASVLQPGKKPGILYQPGSSDKLAAERKEKVRQLVELYGGASKPVRDETFRRSAPSPTAQAAAVAVRASSTSPLERQPVATTPTEPPISPPSTGTPVSPPPPEDVESEPTETGPKKVASVSKRFSFRNFAARVSPAISRKQEKEKSSRLAGTSPVATQTEGKASNQSSSTLPSARSNRAVSVTDIDNRETLYTPGEGKNRARSVSETPLPQPALTVSSSSSNASSSTSGAESNRAPGRSERRRKRYNSVKELTAAATSPPQETAAISPGSSTTPIPYSPSPELTSSVDVNGGDIANGWPAKNGTSNTKPAAKAANGFGTRTNGHRYDEIDMDEMKAMLGPSDSGYSSYSAATTATGKVTPAVSVSSPEDQKASDPIYDEVPFDGGESTDDDLDAKSDDRLDDAYEDVMYHKHPQPPLSPQTSTAMPGSISLNSASDKQRLLWQDLAMVKEKGILLTMSPSEIKHQEAMFEVLSTEESYNQSLHVVLDSYMPRILPASTGVTSASSQCDLPTVFIEKSEHHRLFSNLAALVKISDNFLEELRARLVEQVAFETIADIVLRHVTKHFYPYVNYCTNQTYQLQAAKKLYENQSLKKALKQLESSIGQKLPFSTYLTQPMQRITRLPLLIVAILDFLPEDSPHATLTQQALQEVKLFVAQCNEGARSMERMEELINLQKKVKFDSKTKPLGIVSSKRFLKRSGHLYQFVGNGKKARKNFDKHKVTLFVFNDTVLIAKLKKKPDEYYQVIDYTSLQLALIEECPVSELPTKVVEAERKKASSMLNVSTDGTGSSEVSPQRSSTPGADDASIPTAFKLVFLENWSGKNKEYLLMTENLTDKARWCDVLNEEENEETDGSGKKPIVYELWNCPQHVVLFNYTPQQADELALQAGDVVKVLRKMEDDWCHGELMRDGTRGWFPIQFTEEIKSEDTREENLRQRRLLLAEARMKSENLIDL